MLCAADIERHDDEVLSRIYVTTPWADTIAV